MFNNKEKRFCLGVEEFTKLDGVADSINDFYTEVFDIEMNPYDFLFLIREDRPKMMLGDGTWIHHTLFRETFSPFIREEFSYLFGEKSNAVERRFKELLEVAANDSEDRPKLLVGWSRWFAPDRYVDDEVYETYDFEQSENVIMHILDSLGLPLLQLEFVKDYLKADSRFELSRCEMDLLKMVGKNLLSCDEQICRKLNETIAES